MEYMRDRDFLKVSGQWNVLWKMQIPPKVKHFLWRVTRRILPLRSNLIRRRIPVPPECGLCNSEQEDEFHLFLHCPKAKDVWRAADLLEKIASIDASTTFADWIGNFLRTSVDSIKCHGAMVMWGLWGGEEPAGVEE
ncbi:hypothetical protein LINPERHAP1_LOCUS16372 [Linum perenne]